MASDKQQFARAEIRYHELLEGEQFSVAPDAPDAKTAVLVAHPHGTDNPIAPEEVIGDTSFRYDHYAYFAAEGRTLAERIAKRGGTPDLRMPATVADFRVVLRDRAIASIIICGVGNFTAVRLANEPDEQFYGLPSRGNKGYLRWMDLADMADHLKQGLVIQRVCGIFGSSFNAPLAWGVVNNHQNIWAPTRGIFPEDLDHEDNEAIQPITSLRYLGGNAIRETFPRSRNHHGAFNVLPDGVYGAIADSYNAVIDKLHSPPHEHADS